MVNLIHLFREKGGGSTSGSLLTGSNGIKALVLGVRYTGGDMIITGEVNMTEVGGVTITSVASAVLAKYKTNCATGDGLKTHSHLIEIRI